MCWWVLTMWFFPKDEWSIIKCPGMYATQSLARNWLGLEYVPWWNNLQHLLPEILANREWWYGLLWNKPPRDGKLSSLHIDVVCSWGVTARGLRTGCGCCGFGLWVQVVLVHIVANMVVAAAVAFVVVVDVVIVFAVVVVAMAVLAASCCSFGCFRGCGCDCCRCCCQYRRCCGYFYLCSCASSYWCWVCPYC